MFFRSLLLLCFSLTLLAPVLWAAAPTEPAIPPPPFDDILFPNALSHYEELEAEKEITTIGGKLLHRVQEQPFNLIASLVFLCAILHTFVANKFMQRAHEIEHAHARRLAERGGRAEDKPYEDARDDVSLRGRLYHFLGEVEAVFGIWVLVLGVLMVGYFTIVSGSLIAAWHTFEWYIAHTVEYTEPMFVVIIMAIASTRPILRLAERIMGRVAGLGKGSPAAWWVTILSIGPLLGSFMTEPAAMTISALLLAKMFYDYRPSAKFAYATLGLLFVNVSVGGTLTHFAAPPVLIVAAKFDWTLPFMFLHFGWKAILGILVANTLYFFIFRKDFSRLQRLEANQESESTPWPERSIPIPSWITITHVLFLGWTVLTAHFPPLFIGGFLFFLGFTTMTGHHQNAVQLKPALLVGFFLAGLVIHGGLQQWWIAPVLGSLGEIPLMLGATLLTAVNDNAAITFLSSLVPEILAAPELKYAVMAGAVTGGGLTVIANAPNPAGQSILSRYFDGGVNPIYLFLAALVPTIIMGLCFMAIPH